MIRVGKMDRRVTKVGVPVGPLLDQSEVGISEFAEKMSKWRAAFRNLSLPVCPELCRVSRHDDMMEPVQDKRGSHDLSRHGS